MHNPFFSIIIFSLLTSHQCAAQETFENIPMATILSIKQEVNEWLEHYYIPLDPVQRPLIAKVISLSWRLAETDSELRCKIRKMLKTAWHIHQQFAQGDDLDNEIEHLKCQIRPLRELYAIHCNLLDQWSNCITCLEEYPVTEVQQAVEACNNHIRHYLYLWAQEQQLPLYNDLEQAHHDITKVTQSLHVIANFYQAISKGDNFINKIIVEENEKELLENDAEAESSINDIDLAARSSHALYPACWQALENGQQIYAYREKLQKIAALIYKIYYKKIVKYTQFS